MKAAAPARRMIGGGRRLPRWSTWTCVIFLGVAILLVLPAARAGTSGSCTAAEKAQRERALTAFVTTMKARRQAFFRAHKSGLARRAFVRGQQEKLRAFRRAAACTVIPAGAHVIATVPVPNDGGVGVGADAVWVIDRSNGLVRIDPLTNTVIAEIPGVVGAAPVVSEGAVWVPSAVLLNTLLRVDVATHAVTRLATGPSDDEWPITAVATPGALWVGNHHGGSVVRVDPRTNSVVANVPWGTHGGGGPYHMAADGSSVFVSSSRTSDVTQIDTVTNSIVSRTPVPTGTCGGLDVDLSTVWVTSGFDRPYACWSTLMVGVSRIDRTTGEVTRIDVGGRPIDVRLAFGSVWVLLDAPTLALLRLDPQTNRIVGRLPIAASVCKPEITGNCPGAEYATALAVGFGSLWVRIDGPGKPGELLRVEPVPAPRHS